MDKHQHHVQLVKGITEQMKPVLEKSEQAIYLYLDDNHKVCNKKFADLLGYKSPKEWAKTEAPLSDVIEDDQQDLIDAYINASERGIASTLEVGLKQTKTGETIKARVTMAPVPYSGHVFVAHFVNRI